MNKFSTWLWRTAFWLRYKVFVNPISRFICTWLGAFPLNRGAIDKVAIRHAMGLLKDNKVLGIFAEGNRQKSGKLGKFHDGAASIALRTGVSIVPVAIIGSYNMERDKVACIIGKPIPVEKEKATPEAIKKVNDQVKGEIQRMIDSYHENRVEETLWK